MPLRGTRAERARDPPSAFYVTFKVFLYLSLPVVKERPAASRAAGVEIVPGWWAHLDSNQGPLPYQRSALTN